MTPLLRVANAAISYVAYLGEFFYPSGLAIFYPYPVSGVSWGKAACAVLLLAVVPGLPAAPFFVLGDTWYATGANATHGLHRTNADKRRAVTLAADTRRCKSSLPRSR